MKTDKKKTRSSTEIQKIVSGKSPEFSAALKERVDFSYAFALPHRMTVAMPDSSHKTLLDAQNDSLTMSWSYDDLTRAPLATLSVPEIQWRIRLAPTIDGNPLGNSDWQRGGSFLPILDNRYHHHARGTIRLEVIGGDKAAIVKVTARNTGENTYLFAVPCEVIKKCFGHNPAWINDEMFEADYLWAMAGRADRILALGLGSEHYPVGLNTMTLQWAIPPGEERVGWLIRPYEAYRDDLPSLRAHDWAGEFEKARKAWETLFQRAIRVRIPDPGVERALYSCLGDLFIMREPLKDGYMGGLCGTGCYRSCNPFEPALAIIALDQAGFHQEAEDALRVHIDMQEPNGDWTDPKGWGHLAWGNSGYKSWAVMEHFRLTGDMAFLEKVYPRMLASSRWQEIQRQRSRKTKGGRKPVTYGLMPRGRGDCGLKDGDDWWGVFFPHNFLATYADRLSVEAAEILGKKNDLDELRQIHETALQDLINALDKGAIQEDGYRWIPGAPNKTTGSRWGALYALFPCRILAPDHELIEGTFRHIEKNLSPGGVPLHTGLMENGSWVAITADNLAEAHLMRGNGDAAAKYLYAVLNHGTPLFTWCEERGPEAGAKETSGDRQHLWTPVAVVRLIRDMLVMEQDNILHLALGTPRSWLASGQPVSVTDVPTHFGNVSYQIRYDSHKNQVSGTARFPSNPTLEAVRLHIRLRLDQHITSVNSESKAVAAGDGKTIEWKKPQGECSFVCSLTEPDLTRK